MPRPDYLPPDKLAEAAERARADHRIKEDFQVAQSLHIIELIVINFESNDEMIRGDNIDLAQSIIRMLTERFEE